MTRSLRKWLVRLCVCGFCGTTLLGVVGCSGGLSESDMRQFARKGSAEKDEVQPAAQPPAPSAASSPSEKSKTQAPAESRTPVQPQPANTAGDSGTGRSPNSTRSTRAKRNAQPGAAPETAAQPKTVRLAVPTEPLDPAQRTARSLEHLQRIATALENYARSTNTYPAPALLDPSGRPALSWRVTILPQLGYRELYQKFNLNEPWDGPTNKPLLAEIPPEYQSPERFDTNTNYLASSGSSGAFPGPAALQLGRFEDGVSETVLIVEADDALATPWTKPAEYVPSANNPRQNLGGLRSEGFLVIFGGGFLRRVPPDVPPNLIRAIFTADAGDGAASAQASRDPKLDLIPAQTQVASTQNAQTPTPPNGQAPGGGAAAGNGGAVKLAASPQAKVSLTPVPTEAVLLKTKNQLRSLYKTQMASAKTDAGRREFAAKLWKDATDAKGEPTTHYALLQATLEVAIQCGDSETAISALKEIVQTYDVDSPELRYSTLQRLSQGKAADTQGKLIPLAREWSEELADGEDYENAAQLANLAMTLSKRTSDRKQQQELTTRYRELQDSTSLEAAYRSALKTLDKEPDNTKARMAIGRYLCLVRNDWTNGLPILAIGDEPFKTLAERDAANPKSADEQASIANAWWDLGERYDSIERKSLQARALYWYQQALPGLAPGLAKIKAQARIEQLQKRLASNDL